jgi:hypothetical protein
LRSSGAISGREARWLALEAQGLGIPRPTSRRRPPGPADLAVLLDRLGTIQLDAVNVLERTQFLVPFSRLGPYERADLLGMSGPGGPWFEYWGHAASLMALPMYPLVRPRMAAFADASAGDSPAERRRRAWRDEQADYLGAVLEEIRERGPLAASALSDPRRRQGEWWNRRSEGRRALELLFGEGVLAAWRTPNFERVYDLTERVIPADILGLPTPSTEEAECELIAIAARCLGVATVADLAAYFAMRVPVARRRVGDLVEAGRLAEVAVEDWGDRAYLVPGSRPKAPRRGHATLLSPFDSLIWFRDRTQRLFDFRYRIEIYVPKHLRTHGYYVLPLLLGDQLVARFDLKSDRTRSALLVVDAHLEQTASLAAVTEPAGAELRLLAAWLGLERVDVSPRGDLGRALRRSMGVRGAG